MYNKIEIESVCRKYLISMLNDNIDFTITELELIESIKLFVSLDHQILDDFDTFFDSNGVRIFTTSKKYVYPNIEIYDKLLLNDISEINVCHIINYLYDLNISTIVAIGEERERYLKFW